MNNMSYVAEGLTFDFIIIRCCVLLCEYFSITVLSNSVSVQHCLMKVRNVILGVIRS